MIEKIMKYVKHPENVFIFLQNRCNFRVLSDKAYLSICYKLSMGEKLNLENPVTFTEKLQWLKIYDRKPEYTRMVDKYEAKTFIAEKIGEKYIIPTLGVWDHFDDIDFDNLPEQFVLKCTHDSGGLVIVKDKAKMDKTAARRKIEKSLKKNYFYSAREWPYKDVQPRIIAEPYLEESGGCEPDCPEKNLLKDYKFFCFNGQPKVMFIAQELSEKPENDYFDMEFTHLPLHMKDEVNAPVVPSKPDQFGKMKEIAEILSQGIPHVRVDFYYIEDQLYVGELTFYHCSGMAPIKPEEWNYRLGSWIQLPQ